ncbi:MAG TPA: DUF2269 family protein [Actinomycetota bacterium]|nr:DUF2269 family protein [Actinomycetota bacterium]
MVAAFVGNQTWFTVLLVTHVFGAIMGLGPTFAFAIIGPAIGKQESPQASLALMEIMEKIEKGIVLPILLIFQLGSGILLIFNRGLNVGFFTSHRAWLLAGIGVYLAAMVISMFIDVPAMGRLIHMAKGGQAGTPEFAKNVKITQSLGPVLTVMALAIMLLMIWKPGSGCGALLRC